MVAAAAAAVGSSCRTASLVAAEAAAAAGTISGIGRDWDACVCTADGALAHSTQHIAHHSAAVVRPFATTHQNMFIMLLLLLTAHAFSGSAHYTPPPWLHLG